MQLLTKNQQELEITHNEHEQPTHAHSRVFSALRHRNFRLFWSGQLISLIGTWMQTTGQSWLVLQLTHSAWILGIVGALQFLPMLLFSLFGGVIADRLPKRRMLLVTQLASLLLAATLWLLVFTGVVQLWHVFILATLLGITNAFDMPTRQSFVVEMVGREDLPNAVALNSSIFNMARIIGPGIAGLLIAWLGEGPLFLLNAVSFIPVIISLFMIHEHELRVHHVAKAARDIEEFARGPILCCAHPCCAADHRDCWPCFAVWHQLQRHPATDRRWRLENRSAGLRIPLFGVRPRLATFGAVAGLEE